MKILWLKKRFAFFRLPDFSNGAFLRHFILKQNMATALLDYYSWYGEDFHIYSHFSKPAVSSLRKFRLEIPRRVKLASLGLTGTFSFSSAEYRQI